LPLCFFTVLRVCNQGAMTSIINRLARPNDLGFSEFGGVVEGLKAVKGETEQKAKKTQQNP